MANLSRIGIVIIVFVALLLQLPIVQNFVTLLRLGLGFGKTIQPIGDFQHQCRRINHVHLQACEDMWLSEATRQLFLGCSDAGSRSQWVPGEGEFNVTGRPTQDAIIIMNMDTLDIRKLPAVGFTGTAGDGIMNIFGFTGLDKDDGSIELFVTNFRPSVDHATGQVLSDQAAVGANGTIEVFRFGPHAETLEHVRTLADPVITSPNRVAAVEGTGLYITNDHGQQKTGLRSQLSVLLQTGEVAFCPIGSSSPCEIVSSGHGYPNGLIYSSVDQHIYLPCSAEGRLKVLKAGVNNSLEVIDKLDPPYALDNLSEDKDGVIWAAAIPRGLDIMRQSKAPFTLFPAATVLRISRASNGTYEVKKVLEDRDGEVLPGATTVVHDVSSRRLILSGMFSPFITVCDGVD
ncbi:calcium-dependent phosphotriesterase [Cryphonectria parasitica EP155]|uniref:Calcium-dependent phosphotriesterase n=1 Tax=Cryphonectria parasitica (strain ATCC 38755 / EP155) TaxID=660469 RepID=A0A9P4Y5Z2_CRYP1|nr:calcium-dependent phosphotriesterase [Cryphonectria parasitica EP155]KAF3767168.1 calcium-dependent phosphotriesterase [Cryphonectria parasitica EP155]